MTDAPAPSPQPESGPESGPASGPDATPRDAAIRELSRLTLPLMWTMRQDAMRLFEPHGVRPIKALVLELIERGMLHPTALAEALDTNPPAISSLLADLEASGWISRTPDPDDRRRVVLGLTAEGRALLERLRERWLELAFERLAGVDGDDLRTLIRVYRRFLASAHPGHAATTARAESAAGDAPCDDGAGDA